MSDVRLPVTVLTGYLGAGKTTLLNRILSEHHGRRYAVIVNEFGELGVDGDIVVGADDKVFTMNNGCLCCTVCGDLIGIINGILDRAPELDGILIETTGLAHPAPVAQTFFMELGIHSRTRLDAFVAVADAKHLDQQLTSTKEVETQLTIADLVLLNKIDLVEPHQLAASEGRIRAINPSADIRRTQRSKIPVAEVLDGSAFDLSRGPEDPDGFVDDTDPHHDAAHHHHNEGIESFSMELERPLDIERFLPWIESLLARNGDDLFRVKGVLDFEGHNRRFVFQAVHRIAEGDFLDRRPGTGRHSKLVFIGRSLDRDRLRRNFEACQARPGAVTAVRREERCHE